MRVCKLDLQTSAGTALLGSDARTAQWHSDCAARACQPAPEPALLLRVQALLAQVCQAAYAEALRVT